MNEYLTLYFASAEGFNNDNTSGTTDGLSNDTDIVSTDVGTSPAESSRSDGTSSGAVVSDVTALDYNSADLPTVSDGNIYQAQLLALQEDTTADTITVLQDIDATLNIILFFIVFAWCEHKIKNAVRSFTGRGLL